MKFDHLPIFNNISFSAKKSEIIAVKGKNGAGKTSLLHCLAGVIPKHIKSKLTGEVSYEGNKLYPPADKCRVFPQYFGLLSQDPDKQICFPYIDEELLFGAENMCKDMDSVKKRHQEMTEIFPFLSSQNGGSPETYNLSFGEKKILLFASQVIKNPDIFLLDEPSAGLSGDLLSRMEKLLIGLQKEGKIIVIAEHSN
ncbi:MAG: energy-coupling factor ABC transporter ATP-binding protein, partial [Candidatus Cloacimonetes bacterium]|nr:energy-coupling factor ABC transporter ATP-binding protein [Candidatus Cloacimonadota bacterium]